VHLLRGKEEDWYGTWKVSEALHGAVGAMQERECVFLFCGPHLSCLKVESCLEDSVLEFLHPQNTCQAYD
jgi:hypothetical protein